MMKVLLFLSPFIAIGIVYYVKTSMQDKHRPYILGSLWVLILVFASLLFISIYNEIKFTIRNRDRKLQNVFSDTLSATLINPTT